MHNNRYSSLDILKSLSALLVVYLHFGVIDGTSIISSVSYYINAVGRIAVPLFFMITGYFYADQLTKQNQIIYLKKILKLAVKASVFYFIFYSLLQLLEGNLLFWLEEKITFKRLLLWIVVNDEPITGHLWYLYALIYIMVIFYITDKLKLNRLLFIAVALLFMAHLYLNFTPYCIHMRNFLFLGLPYVCLGRFIREYEKKLKPIFSSRLLWIIFISSTVLLYFEQKHCLTIYHDLRESYLMSFFMASALFLLAIKYPNYGKDSIWEEIGKNHSTHIYIYHYFIGVLWCNLFTNPSPSLRLTYPLIIYAISYLWSLFIHYLNTKHYENRCFIDRKR